MSNPDMIWKHYNAELAFKDRINVMLELKRKKKGNAFLERAAYVDLIYWERRIASL